MVYAPNARSDRVAAGFVSAIGGRLFLLLLGGQPFDDRLLTFRVVGSLELEIESRQQDVGLHVIGQYGDDLLEQFDSLVGFALSLDQLR